MAPVAHPHSQAPGTANAPTPPAPSLTFRMLPIEEWERLRNFGPFAEAGGVLPDPASAIVCVLENEHGAFVGSWMVRNMALLEGLFVAEEHRHSIVASKKLLLGMIGVLADQKVGQAMTLAGTPEIGRLAIKAGFTKLPGVPFLLDRSRT